MEKISEIVEEKRTYIIVSVIFLILISILMFTNKDITKEENNTNSKESSVVSEGVNIDDLGNIINGQYYFTKDGITFYSSFDDNNQAHIYKKENNSVESIFDGFGWSFVLYDGWLYFSGNEGKEINDAYNLYRMKTDGTNIEILDNNFCYNMNFYDGWLYYVGSTTRDSADTTIYRMKRDKTNKEAILTDTNSLFIIYEDKLYYSNSEGLIYRADSDGTNEELIINENTSLFIIGNAKIIYAVDDTIKTSNIDGTNVKIINSNISSLSRINSYKNNIYYTTYGDYDYSKLAYSYNVYRTDFEASFNNLVYQSYSYGQYINLVDDKLLVLDYAALNGSSSNVAIAKQMNLDGKNLITLER